MADQNRYCLIGGTTEGTENEVQELGSRRPCQLNQEGDGVLPWDSITQQWATDLNVPLLLLQKLPPRQLHQAPLTFLQQQINSFQRVRPYNLSSYSVAIV